MQREVWEPAIEDRCPVRPVRRVGIRAITHAAADDLRYLLILQTVDGFVLPGMHTGPRGVGGRGGAATQQVCCLGLSGLLLW